MTVSLKLTDLSYDDRVTLLQRLIATLGAPVGLTHPVTEPAPTPGNATSSWLRSLSKLGAQCPTGEEDTVS